jgi:predicted MFS family arabinose efflux permease
MASAEAPGYRALLQSPGVAPLLAAMLLARLGTRMFSLTLVLFMLGRFHSPALAGWATFLSLAPGLIASPIAGTLLDRLGTLHAIRIDLLLSAAILLALSLLGAHLPPAPVLLLLGLLSLTSPLGWAGARAALPRLVPQALWPRVNALDTATYGLVDVTGPALGGFAVAALGAPTAFAIVAGVYAAAVVSLLAVGPVPAPAAARRGVLADTADGILHFVRHPTLRALGLCTTLYNAAWGGLAILVPVVARASLGPRGDAAAGLFWTVAGAAGLVASLAAGRLPVAGNERRFLAIGQAITALAIFPLAAYGGLTGLALALALLGLVAGPTDVALITLRLRRTEPAWFARILVLSMSLNVAGMPIGAAIAGQLVHVSLPLTFAVAALASLAGAAAVALIPRERATP